MKKMNEIENTLRDLLRSNIVTFTYRKVDGSIRHALGTRNLSLAERYTETIIPTPTGDMQPNSYYDVQSNGWRSWKEGNVISIDGCKIGWRAVETPKKGELPKREIPISKVGVAVELPPTFGSGTAEEIRKSMDKLGKDIVIGAPAHSPKVGTPVSGGKVGKPTDVGYGMALPINGIGGEEMTIDDFAKLVAKYVVAELADRLTK